MKVSAVKALYSSWNRSKTLQKWFKRRIKTENYKCELNYVINKGTGYRK